LFANRESILAGQSKIQNDEVGRIALHTGQHLIAVRDDLDSKVVALEIAGYQLGKPQIILYQEYRHGYGWMHGLI
jgi:hypothetical protein